MKTFLSCLLLAFTCLITKAQTFKPFKVTLTAGYAFPSGDAVKGGLTSAVDVQYALNDHFTVGVFGAIPNLGPKTYTFTTGDERFLEHSELYCVTGTVYISTATVRPFLTLGAGFGRVHTVDGANALASTTIKNTVPVVVAGGGVEVFHFRLIAGYTFAGKAEGINSSFPSISAGFFLGGGRKK